MKPLKFIHVVWLTTRVLTLGHAAFAQIAQVTVTNQLTGLTRESVSNGEGYFSLPQLPPGQYRTTSRKTASNPSCGLT
jgi:Carboxypeptidase regulatory-like domain